MKYEFTKLEIDGLILINPKPYYDERGFFMESYTREEFERNGIGVSFVQDNHSFSIKNVLRGMHFQKAPFGQSKLVRCISGEILDVAVDIRPESKTSGKYVKIKLSSENKYMLFIPEGFAHGFLVLSDFAEVLYKVDKPYNKEAESGFIWNDPDIGIDWPIGSPILSRKDSSWPRFHDLSNFLR